MFLQLTVPEIQTVLMFMELRVFLADFSCVFSSRRIYLFFFCSAIKSSWSICLLDTCIYKILAKLCYLPVFFLKQFFIYYFLNVGQTKYVCLFVFCNLHLITNVNALVLADFKCKIQCYSFD